LSSTSDDIIKVFDKANEYQETTSKKFPVISVVLLENGKYNYNVFICIFLIFFKSEIVVSRIGRNKSLQSFEGTSLFA